MRWFLPLLCLSGLVQAQPAWKASPYIAATDSLPAEKQAKAFHLPPGFEMQRV